MDYRSAIPVSVSYDPTRATIRHQLRRSLREDREHWRRNRAAAMEAAHANGDTRQLFQLIRSSGHKRLGVSETICKSDGTPITDQRQRLQRWAEHFQLQFTSTTQPSNTDDQQEPRATWSLSEDPPSSEEVKIAISHLKNHKAPGIDEITAELLKSGSDALVDQLTLLFSAIWGENTYSLSMDNVNHNTYLQERFS